jgi:hypothetical protein
MNTEFDSRQGQEILRHSVHTKSGADPPSYPMCKGGCFLENKAAPGVKLTTRLHLHPLGSRDSTVGVATGYGLED